MFHGDMSFHRVSIIYSCHLLYFSFQMYKANKLFQRCPFRGDAWETLFFITKACIFASIPLIAWRRKKPVNYIKSSPCNASFSTSGTKVTHSFSFFLHGVLPKFSKCSDLNKMVSNCSVRYIKISIAIWSSCCSCR